METTRTIPCPCCKKILFRQLQQQRNGKGDAIWRNAPDRPDIENDAKGYFIKCIHCSKRIAMYPDPVHPNAGYLVSPDQQCNQIIT